MAAPPEHAKQERRRHLLGGRAQVHDAVSERDALAAAFVHGVVRAHGVRVLSYEPLEPEPRTDLLVGGGDEDHVAGAAPAFARERRERDGGRSHLALHVECAAAPDLVADQLGPERVVLPCGRVGEHDVGMREERERRPVTGAAKPCDEVCTLGHTREELALDPRRLEVVAQQLRRQGLVAGRVRRIDADEPLEQLADFAHLRVPRTSK